MRKNSIHTLSRYIKLSVLLDILVKKKITLLPPNNWTDKNDAFVMDEYRKKNNASYVYAVCFSADLDSVYHWEAFSKGGEVCRLDIRAEKFLARIGSYQNLECGLVEYLPVNFKRKIPLSKYPFLKRKQFACEKEFRLVLLSENPSPVEIDLDPSDIDEISLSDQMPKSVAESVKKVIDKICPGVRVYCSTLNDNTQWQNHFK